VIKDCLILLIKVFHFRLWNYRNKEVEDAWRALFRYSRSAEISATDKIPW